jgi:hypothetical protein
MERTNTMTQYNSNVSIVVGSLKQKLIGLKENPDAMLRTVAFTVLPEMKKRVHVDGRDSTGNQIGTYSTEYMKVRTGDFGNSGRFSKGKKKGEVKDAGVISRGPGKGKPRPKYNRTADTKVILSLTRQMENDMSVLPSGTGYGIGYNNQDNFKKSQYNEATYKKKIWNLTEEEKLLAKDTAQLFVDDYLKN